MEDVNVNTVTYGDITRGSNSQDYNLPSSHT